MRITIEKNITTYITYFRDHLDLVKTHCPDTEDGHLHSKILYSAFLDAISGTVFDKKNHRERFISFVTEFCNWPDHHRVSLPHLLRLVRNKPEPEFAPLRDFTSRKISQWIPTERISLDRDPSFNEIELVWPHVNGKQLKIDGLSLTKFQHRHLLYTYRNNLIHEFKITGRRVELWNIDKPYYSYLSEIQSEDSNNLVQSWELQYTAKFFKKLCTSGIDNLEIYLLQHQIDPFLSIDWGNYWIRELNI